MSYLGRGEFSERIDRLEKRLDLIKRMVSRLSEGKNPTLLDIQELDDLEPLQNNNLFPDDSEIREG